MIPTTTPTHSFNSPCDTSLIAKVTIFYMQDDVLLLKKKTSDCIIKGNVISVKLKSEETRRFDHKKNASVQCVIETIDGTVIASLESKIKVDRYIGDGVIE